ncbi:MULTISPECIES: DNA-binding protein [Hymenobacter]|uniref:DNA-binding protein n=1 Tax=Hymenobacter profundi TaxID=1982110 RepID=A0ABS6X1B2_9BACT|nr:MULTISPECIES: DNA-binding protein [Hymenobacter]MBW3129454.1 hypothetical protein [Hymenobacter profundi]QNE41123.1 DNA-binding protein [Hymenobacter sp. NBH84]
MTTAPEELYSLGNLDLLQLPKTAFFCSRNYPPTIRRGTYLWALEQRTRHRCIVSGFHSEVEQTVFRYLLRSSPQPVVYVVGRGIQPSLALEYEREIEAGRLVFVSPFAADVLSTTQETADIRNMLVVDLADQTFIPYMSAAGNLDRLLRTERSSTKPLVTLNVPENAALQHQRHQIYQPLSLLGGKRAAQG